MSHKTFTQASIGLLMALALFAIPISANAGGACDSTYTVQSGDTLGSIAEICGTTVSDLYNANPGIGGTLYAGQVLTIPSNSSNYNNNNYNNYNGYNNSNGYNNNPNNYNYAPTSAYGTYVVQPGDTFGDIANRYGVSINDLANANPYIGNEDLLYPGQVINIPAPSWPAPTPVPPWYPPQPTSPTLVWICANARSAVVSVSASTSTTVVRILSASLVARILRICANSNRDYDAVGLRTGVARKPNGGRTIVQ